MVRLLEDLLQDCCDTIVQTPCTLQVTSTENSLLIEITPPRHQVGVLIGKRGATIDALRRLAMVAAGPGLSVHLDVLDGALRRQRVHGGHA